MGAVYLLTLRQLSGRWRIAILTALAALPVVITLLVLSDAGAPTVAEYEGVVLSAMLAGTIGPLVVLAIGGAAFANEVEDRTLANLTLAPIPRWQIVVPKLLAVISLAAPFIGASAFITAHIAFLADARATIAVTLAAVFGVALYGAFFVWLGLVSTQAIGLGLFYIVLWEGFFAGFVSGVRLFSIRHYTLGLMHAMDPRRFAAEDLLSTPAAIAVAVVVFGGFTWLAIRRMRRMDIP